MLGEMSLTELREWIAYSEVEPFDEERADLRSASICAVIANANRDPKKRSAFKITDFLLKFGRKVRKFKTSEEMEQIAINFFKEYDPDQLKQKKK